MKNKGDFTQKEAQFVFHYPRCSGNGTKAAIAAGYSERTAKGTACELLKRPHIAAALASYLEKKLTKLDVTVDRVLQERARMAFYDIGHAAGARLSGPQDIANLPDHIRNAVTGWKWDKAGNFVLEFADKNPNLVALEKYLGMYDDEAARPGVFNIFIHLEQNNGKSA